MFKLHKGAVFCKNHDNVFHDSESGRILTAVAEHAGNGSLAACQFRVGELLPPAKKMPSLSAELQLL